MTEALGGIVAVGFILAAALFFYHARDRGERLFFAFAAGLALLALNQLVAIWLGDDHENIGYAHLLRVIAFVVILVALVPRIRRSGS
jgi:ABC-type nitrate/sulfonate/bicarbonate transport system permease component